MAIAGNHTGRICPKGSSAGIVFTHGPIFGFFAPQGRHVAPIKVKFGTEERTVGVLALVRAVLALDLEGVHDVKLHHPSSSVATSNQ